MAAYFPSLRNCSLIHNIQSAILLSFISVVCGVTQAEQSAVDIPGEGPDSSAVIKASGKDQPSSQKVSKDKYRQNRYQIQTDEKSAHQDNKKAISRPVQVIATQAPEHPASMTKTSDQELKVAPINNQEAITRQPGFVLTDTSENLAPNMRNDPDTDTPKDAIADKQGDETNILVKNETVAAAPKAKNVDLEKPIRESDILPPEKMSSQKPKEKDKSGKDAGPAEKIAQPDFEEQYDNKVHDTPFLLLGAEVPPGTSTRLSWLPSQSFQGIAAPTPVLVVNGVKPGPVLCLTAAVHGDELNGIEMVRRVLYQLEVEELSGTVIGVPIVNLQGFRRTSRYLPDRRDLNRFFPGDPKGSSAARIAYSFFHEIISKCNALVDLHTGSFYRTNLPQLRADLTKPEVVEITQGFGATVILNGAGTEGTLRRAAVDAGIPAVTLEAGEPMRLQEDQVSHGVKGIKTLMNKLGMYDYSSFWGDPEPVYYKSEWVRANQGGILFSQVELGEKVNPGELLGTITDPITNVRSKLVSPYKGRIIGMALNQVVMPGFAAFHVGIQATEKEVIQTDDDPEKASDNHTSEITTDSKRNVAESEKKLLKQDNRDSLVGSE